ncbi:carbon-nitrogen hydrolase family protein [Cupriavidus basilensis]|uniref:carbon-nitrogen hydrolase family protein n=1 Tax=Cupriavidus basilensis TaxID=68895 RepID=UPI0005BE541B|nr:carbon-nitrogen hydrolase family protein [Cupriavidus basilensis]
MPGPFAVAAAQSISVPGDVRRNVELHLAFLREAAVRHARLVVFPELSLTGYESSLAKEVAIHDDDTRLIPLRDECVRSRLTAVVGAPLRFGDGVRIGALTLTSNGKISSYTKQYLHPGEDTTFVPGSGGPPFSVDGEIIALAVCADTGHLEHAAQASATGANLYAVGALITANGYATDTALLQQYATQHRFAVLMANHGGDTGGWSPIGKSAFWDEKGSRIVAADGPGAALVIASRTDVGWHGEVVSLR